MQCYTLIYICKTKAIKYTKYQKLMFLYREDTYVYFFTYFLVILCSWCV